MAKPLKRVVGGVAMATLATGAILAIAPAAQAGTTTGQAECSIPADVQSLMGGKPKVTGPQPYTVTGPESAAAGSEIELNIDLGASPASSPAAVPAKMTPTVEFKTSGASTAPITAKAAQFSMNLTTGAMDLPAFKVKVKVPADAKAGSKLELTPVKLTLDVDAGMKLSIPCTTTGAGVVFSTNVTAAGGTTSTTNTTSTTSSTGESLPKTGPLDDALSMGLVGGTVGLFGIGAVLIATRKVRQSRSTV